MSADLEALRSMFQDRRTHLSLAVIEKLELVPDKSAIRAQCSVFPEENKVIATVGWPGSAPDAGLFFAPSIGDLVLLGYVGEDMIYIIARLSSPEDTIPDGVFDGHTLVKARTGKNVIVTGRDTLLGSEDADEPAVLGNVLMEYVTSIHTRLDAIIDLLLAGNLSLSTVPGNPTAPNPAVTPTIALMKVEHLADKAEFLDTSATDFLAQHIFVEKGSLI